MKKNKIIALILSVLMLASCVPFVASADTTDTGNGIQIGDKTYADGTTLVSMDTILKYDLSATAEGTTVAEGVEFTDIQVNPSTVTYGTYSETGSTYASAVQDSVNGNMTIGQNGGACYTVTSGGGAYQKVGTNTNLPLNESTKYTIHFEVKISEYAYNMNVSTSVKNFVGFEFFAETTSNRKPTGSGSSRGILVELDTSSRSPGKTDFLASGDCANTGISDYFNTSVVINQPDSIWDTDRYVAFDVEIDGKTIRVYADGVKQFDFTFKDSITYTETLGLYMMGRIGSYRTSTSNPMFWTKNFYVKAGNVAGKQSISFDQPTNITMLVGETQELLVEEGSTFASSDESVATVSEDGTITAHKRGNATITVTSGSKSATINVTVTLDTSSVTNVISAINSFKSQIVQSDKACGEVEDRPFASSAAFKAINDAITAAEQAAATAANDTAVKEIVDNLTDAYTAFRGEVKFGEHIWNHGEITTQPTVDSEGVKTFTCTGCGETKTEKVDKLTASDMTSSDEDTSASNSTDNEINETTEVSETDDAQEKSGCGSYVGVSGAALVAVSLCSAVLVGKKKKITSK